MVLINQNICSIFLVIGFAAGAFAGDKREYTLLNPVPPDQMRPMATDRPDATESARTVDAGHVQLEIDIAAYVRDHAQEDRMPVRVEEWSFAVTNVRIGLTHNTELDIVIATYVRVETDDRGMGTSTTADGFGDLVLRAKINLRANDDEDEWAIALLPFVKLPTASDELGDDEVEAGLVVPFNTSLPGGWDFGLQIEIAVVRNSSDTDHDVDVAQTIVFGHAIVGDLSGFIEFFSLFPGESGADWVGTLNGGLTFAVNENLQLDLAANLGVTRAAPDVVVFAGVSVRF